MWKLYKVTWQFLEKLCSSTPTEEEVIKKWIESRQPTVRPPGGKTTQEMVEEVLATVVKEDIQQENEDIEKRTTLNFQQWDGVLGMRGGTVRAHLKDGARSMTRQMGKLKGEMTFAQKVVQYVYPKEYWVPILRDGKPLAKPDDAFDKAVHVMTRMGPINALKRIHYVLRPTMAFHLRVWCSPKGPAVDMTELNELMTFCCVKAYAGERGDMEGQYKFRIEEGGMEDSSMFQIGEGQDEGDKQASKRVAKVS